MRRRLLLLCATPEFTGPAELMLEDARTLRDAGHDVTIAFDTRRPGSLRAKVEEAGLPIEESLDLCRIASPRAFAIDILRLRRQLVRGRWDTLHARFSHDHHLVLLALAGLDRSAFRLIRSCELEVNAARGMARSLAYGATDRFAVPSGAHARALARNHALDPARIDLLPGRVDASRFTPGPSRLRTELGIPESAPVVGIVSRIKPDRRHRDLLLAFARARREVPGAWLVIIGRGEGEPSIRAQVEELGLAPRTRFAGYRSGPALEDAYRALDVKAWLAPGNDGTCRAVLEGMAAGCAILGGDFAAVAEAVVDGATGRLCDPSDHDATGRSLAWLLADRERAAALGIAGRQRVLERYAPERRAATLHNLYDAAWSIRSVLQP